MAELNRTPLYDLHVARGAKMVPFAGYEMPVQYTLGVMKEHLHCRGAAGLFDVSHMGQVLIRGAGAAEALEQLIPVDILGLGEGRQRYGFLTDAEGGILDDLMITNRGDDLLLVLNAACKVADIAHIRAHLPPGVELTPVTDRALLALQGPAAEDALAHVSPAVRDMRFMDGATVPLLGVDAWVSRSGYTGEDGFEISVPAAQAVDLAEALLSQEAVELIGLGARDSLRLEAGLCLYGHDIDTATTPVEAGLTWAIQKVRRPGGARASGYLGADVIEAQLTAGAPRRRVGLLPEGRAPMREGVPLFLDAEAQTPIGHITSGGFGPSVERPIAMGYVPTEHSAPGTLIFGELRGKRLPLTISPLPFRPAGFKR